MSAVFLRGGMSRTLCVLQPIEGDGDLKPFFLFSPFFYRVRFMQLFLAALWRYNLCGIVSIAEP